MEHQIKGEHESYCEEIFINNIVKKSHIEMAKELAKKEVVLDKIVFVKGALEELKEFKNKSFDMVISFDAPVVYTYPKRGKLFVS